MSNSPATVPTFSRYRWLVLGAATLSQASAAFVTQGLAVLAGFIETSLHLSRTEVGLLFAAAALAPVFTLLFVGNLLDLKSERHIVAAGVAVMALGLALAASSSGFATLLLALFVVGAGYSTIQPGGSRSVSNWFGRRELGLAMGIRQAGLPLGGAAAAFCLPLVIGHADWRRAFALCLLVVLAGGVQFYALYRVPESLAAAPAPARKRLSVAVVLAMLRQPWMVRVTVAGAVLVCVQYGIVVNLMFFLRDKHHVALGRGAAILALAQLCGGAGRIALAALGDRGDGERQRYFPVALSFAATALGLLALLLLPAATPLAALTALALWLGFFGLGWYGPWVAYIAYAAPRESLGLALGIAMAVNQITIVATPPLLGLLYDWSGSYSHVWLFLLLAQGAAFLVMGVNKRQARARPAS